MISIELSTKVSHKVKYILNPLLFIIYISVITKNPPKSVIMNKYADDIALLIKKSLKSCKSLIEKSLKIINENLKELGLELASQKPTLIHVNELGVKPGSIEVKLGDTSIISQQMVRYLGVLLDYQFSFKQHIDRTVNKRKKGLNITKFVRSVWRGADPSTLITLFVYFSKKNNL